MSCLTVSLKLPPARKAWKIFTSKLQKKLRMFQYRPNKLLPYNRPPRTTRRQHKALRPRKPVSTRGKNQHPSSSNSLIKLKPRLYQPRRYTFKKRNVPVFVDKLFKESTNNDGAVSVAELVSYKKSKVRSIDKSSAGAGTSGYMESDVPTGPESAGMSNDGGDGDGEDCIWESVGFASPSMHNINERAEAFIAKFRADMKRQEAMARRQS